MSLINEALKFFFEVRGAVMICVMLLENYNYENTFLGMSVKRNVGMNGKRNEKMKDISAAILYLEEVFLFHPAPFQIIT